MPLVLPISSPILFTRDALGLGLRQQHYDYVLEHGPDVDYFEIISENFMGNAWPPEHNLGLVMEHYPIVLHGVGLNLLGHEPIDEDYLDHLVALANKTNAAFVSDHLCWTGSQGRRHHELLPTPYTHDLVDYAAERAAYVQRRLGRPLALENLSSYVSFQQSDMSESKFYAAVVQKADVKFMLDINNIYVSSQNQGFDPLDYLQDIAFERVVQVHLAGHERQVNGSIIDTHDRPVAEAVWDLYREAWRLGGPFPTLLEWDEDIPPMPVMLDELKKARVKRV